MQPTTSPPFEPPRASLFAALGLVAAVRAVFLLVHDARWWGLNVAAYLPDWGAWAATVCAALCIGWAARQRDRQPATAPASHSGVLLEAAVVAAFGLLFFFAAIPFSLLGDSTMLLGQTYRYLTSHEHIEWIRAPLSMILTESILWVQTTFDISKSTAFPFHVSGALCGAGFVAAALMVGRDFFSSVAGRVLTGALLISSGGALLFFGYVETYAVQYALVLVYCAVTMRFLAGRTSIVMVLATAALCILAHYQHVLLLPSLAAAMYVKRSGRAGGRFVLRILGVTIPLLLVVYFAVEILMPEFSASKYSPFVPLREWQGRSYTMFSGQHLLDLVNEFTLLAAVPLAVIAVLGRTQRRVIDWCAPRVVFLITAITFSAAFLAAGNFVLGLARDWDVCSALGILVALLALESIRQTIPAGAPLRAVSIATAGVALAGWVAWIAVNVNMDSSIGRYTDLVSLYRNHVPPQVTRFGYENLRKYALEHGDYHLELQLDQRMLEALPWHFDAGRAISIMEQHAPVLGEQGAAELLHVLTTIEAIPSDTSLRNEIGGDEGQVRLAPHGSGDCVAIGDFYCVGILQEWANYGHLTFPQAIAHADTFIRRHPALPYGYQLKGRLLAQHGEPDAAVGLYNRAIAIDSERAYPYFARANVAFDQKMFDGARADLKRALQLDSSFFLALSGMCALFEMAGRGAADLGDCADVERLLRSLIQKKTAEGAPVTAIGEMREALAHAKRYHAALLAGSATPRSERHAD